MTHLVTICVQRTTFQLVHCRHFENGGRVVCVSADSLRAHHRQQTITQMTRGEREVVYWSQFWKRKSDYAWLGRIHFCVSSQEMYGKKLLWIFSQFTHKGLLEIKKDHFETPTVPRDRTLVMSKELSASLVPLMKRRFSSRLTCGKVCRT